MKSRRKFSDWLRCVGPGLLQGVYKNIEKKNNLIPRKIARVALANKRFEIGAFIDGAGALMAIPNESPDLILCDLQLSDGHGVDLVQHLRALPEVRRQ